MEFLQPSWLWGMLAAAVPVAIHFWNQKKGKTIQWAASRWLVEKTTLNHRGIRLHEIPLMLVRCLLLILLASILSTPVLDWLGNQLVTETIHLVQPDPTLTSNFRFELENALRRDEKVYWIGEKAEKVRDPGQVPATTKSDLYLQETINKTVKDGNNVKLYLLANQQLAMLPKVYVPGSFQIYALPDTIAKRSKAFKFGNGRGFEVLVSYKNASEQATVLAALRALTNVYDTPLSADLKFNPKKSYDLIATDSIPDIIHQQTLYVVSGNIPRHELPANVFQLPDSLRLRSSEMVDNGRLPEVLGMALLKHNQSFTTHAGMSSQQLNALFVQTKPMQTRQAGQMRKWLLLSFVLILLLERGMSLRKKEGVSYA